MLIVCVHYPLDPQMSKKCMAEVEHRVGYVTELKLPLFDSASALETSLWELHSANLINGAELVTEMQNLEKERREKFMDRVELFKTKWSAG